jgi:epoxyqueuosine reductase
VPLGDRVYGCDDCLDACPPGHKRLSDGAEGVGRINLLDFLAADDETLLGIYSHFYIPRRRPRILRRNAIIALANTVADAAEGHVSPDSAETALDVLKGYLNGPDEQLRLHAAWAIGRIGGDRAQRTLDDREAVERVPQVREEIRVAITGLRLSESK